MLTPIFYLFVSLGVLLIAENAMIGVGREDRFDIMTILSGLFGVPHVIISFAYLGFPLTVCSFLLWLSITMTYFHFSNIPTSLVNKSKKTGVIFFIATHAIVATYVWFAL